MGKERSLMDEEKKECKCKCNPALNCQDCECGEGCECGCDECAEKDGDRKADDAADTIETPAEVAGNKPTE